MLNNMGYKFLSVILCVIFSINNFGEVVKSDNQDLVKKMTLGVLESNEAIFNAKSPDIFIKEIILLSRKGEAWAQFTWADISNFCVVATSNAIDINVVIQDLEKELANEFNELKNELLELLLEQQSAELSAKTIENNEISFEFKKKCAALDVTFLNQEEALQTYSLAAEKNYSASNVVASYLKLASALDVDDPINLDIEDIERDLINIRYSELLGDDFLIDTPLTIYTIAEFSPYLFNKYSDYNHREAWLIAACKLGFNNNCNDRSGLITLRFCNVMDDCDSAQNIMDAILLRNGKKRFEEYAKTAKKIIEMYQKKDWSYLGL